MLSGKLGKLLLVRGVVIRLDLEKFSAPEAKYFPVLTALNFVLSSQAYVSVSTNQLLLL